MSNHIVIDLFAEDAAHEALVKSLIARMAHAEDKKARIRVRSAQGGHGRAITRFKEYQRVVHSMVGTPPDLLIVAIDGNCSPWTETRKRIDRVTEAIHKEQLVTACPDPHIERWYLADPESFQRVVGWRPQVGPEKCEREHYKRLLANAISNGGHPETLGGIEFARELAAKMDLYRAGKTVPSLKAFVDAISSRLRRLHPKT